MIRESMRLLYGDRRRSSEVSWKIRTRLRDLDANMYLSVTDLAGRSDLQIRAKKNYYLFPVKEKQVLDQPDILCYIFLLIGG